LCEEERRKKKKKSNSTIIYLLVDPLELRENGCELKTTIINSLTNNMLSKSLQPNNNVKIQVEETPSKNQRTGFLPPFLPSFLSSFLPLGTKTVTGLQIGHDTLLYFCLQRFFYNPIPVLSIQG
jgi:hypothetical protein